MRLGTQTGSLINHVMASSANPTVKVGDGATVLLYTDRYACTIVSVSANGKVVGVQRDISKRTDDNGMSDSQSYDYERNPNAAVEYFSLRKNDRFIGRGGNMSSGPVLKVGVRDEFHDFSF